MVQELHCPECGRKDWGFPPPARNAVGVVLAIHREESVRNVGMPGIEGTATSVVVV